MTPPYYTNSQNTISFQQICLQHYKRILEIATKEFTGGYWNHIIIGNVVNKTYETDKKKEFCQSVEIMADALYPHFDEKMTEQYKKYENNYKDDDKKDKKDKKKERKEISSEDKLVFNKKLFRELSCLLHRLDYLRGSTYSESIDDDDDLDND